MDSFIAQQAVNGKVYDQLSCICIATISYRFFFFRRLASNEKVQKAIMSYLKDANLYVRLHTC